MIRGKAKSETHSMELFHENELYHIMFDGIIALNPTSAKEAKAKWESYVLNYGMVETEAPKWSSPKKKSKVKSERRSW